MILVLPTGAKKLCLHIHLPHVPANYELESCAFLLNAQGKIRHDKDFIFFNNPTAAGAILQKAATGHQFNFDLAQFPNDIEKVVFTLIIDNGKSKGQRFSALNGCYAELLNANTHDVITESEIEAQDATTVVFFEIYRAKQSWKLKTLNESFKWELATLAEHFGVDISDDPEPPQPNPEPFPPQSDPPPQPAPDFQLIKLLKRTWQLLLTFPIGVKAFIGVFTLIVLFKGGSIYADYSDKKLKEQRIQFANAVSQQDFENYLLTCDPCESKKEAEEKVREFKKKNQLKTEKEQTIEQEYQAFLKIESLEELHNYTARPNQNYRPSNKELTQKRKEIAQLIRNKAKSKKTSEKIPIQTEDSALRKQSLKM